MDSWPSRRAFLNMDLSAMMSRSELTRIDASFSPMSETML